MMSPETEQYLLNLPKVDLHRHLEGSIRLSTYWEEALKQKLKLPVSSMEEMGAYLSYMPGEERSLPQFLTKFDWLRRILTNPETLARVTYESLEDVWKDGAVYAELRFNPAGMFQMGMQEDEMAEGISAGLKKARRDFGIRATTISGIARDRGVETATRTTAFSIKHAGDFISGMDLFSNEAAPAEPYRELFARAKSEGMHLTIHAGEMQGSNLGARNVREAILIGAERIGHGVRTVEDPEVVELARERKVLLEMCPTSNYQTGAVKALEDHPLRQLLQSGVHACINTDDPSVSNINLNNEYLVAHDVLGIPLDTISTVLLDSCDWLFDDGSRKYVKDTINQYININKRKEE